MFDEDAEVSKKRSEQGRKNMDFQDFYNSVKLDIRNEADFGNNRTTYPVSQKNREFVELLVERLTGEGYKVNFVDGARPVLKISWNFASST